MSALEVTNVSVRYGNIVGTQGVSFKLNAGETIALVGSNGAGKSSTLKAILGLVDYPDGDVLIDGASLRGLRSWDIVKRGVGYSPEGRRVFPAMTVLENLKVGAYTRAGNELSDSLARVFSYFPRLKERASQRAGSLSGGEQQMLAIGRALMSKILRTISGARPSDGSSSRRSLGRAMSARPIASICCSPPERVPARCSRRSARTGKRE